MNSLDVLTQISAEVDHNRKSDYAINPVFLNRWSPRAFSNKPVTDDTLNMILEAAHWAPSSYNDQPWRFIVAKTEEQLRVFHPILSEFNLMWAGKAPVLILLASDKNRSNGDPNGAHAFDAGTAWGYLALQARMLGLYTHAMGGIDREKARQLLHVPDTFDVHCMIALGYPGEKSELPEAMQQREVPNTRLPLKDVVFEGKVTS
ncbi:nitroreductase family protein [Paenibacillus sp. R14(2021)]|uniref:nitroreductase family protein n=1 Tax=Paenibacillus sp. R14(2021) TaxID=2859228 RepID=UPI001C614182|nr:nitroreductase family protein [Paenibacillus sp. R14(2021)]